MAVMGVTFFFLKVVNIIKKLDNEYIKKKRKGIEERERVKLPTRSLRRRREYNQKVML